MYSGEKAPTTFRADTLETCTAIEFLHESQRSDRPRDGARFCRAQLCGFKEENANDDAQELLVATDFGEALNVPDLQREIEEATRRQLSELLTDSDNSLVIFASRRRLLRLHGFHLAEAGIWIAGMIFPSCPPVAATARLAVRASRKLDTRCSSRSIERFFA